MSADNVQCMSTTAEVAEVMSNLSDWQLPTGERYFRRRICLMPIGADPGAAQKMCRTVIMDLMLCCRGQTSCLFPVLEAHRDFYLREETPYEKDTLYYLGKGSGDP